MQRPAGTGQALVLIKEVKRSHAARAHRTAITRNAALKRIVAGHAFA